MAVKGKRQKGRHPGGKIRVQIPASVGFDLDNLQKSVGNLAERLGCPECFSGFDCTFSQESRFVIDAKTLMIDTVPLPEDAPVATFQRSTAIGTWPTPENQLDVVVPDKIAYDLEAVRKSLVNLGERLGCPECFSGYDCTFSRESRFFVNAKTLRIDTVPLPE